MYVYCTNNPVCSFDPSGRYKITLPVLAKGLNLPVGQGTTVPINGETYYYYSVVQRGGYTYEYWYDVNGNLVHVRHNTDHKQPWAHEDPHDHKGGKDKDGHNTIIKTPLPKDEDFHPPEKDMTGLTVSTGYGRDVAIGIVAGYTIYQVIKWAAATIAAPYSGGLSYGVAAALP